MAKRVLSNKGQSTAAQSQSYKGLKINSIANVLEYYLLVKWYPCQPLCYNLGILWFVLCNQWVSYKLFSNSSLCGPKGLMTEFAFSVLIPPGISFEELLFELEPPFIVILFVRWWKAAFLEEKVFKG